MLQKEVGQYLIKHFPMETTGKASLRIEETTYQQKTFYKVFDNDQIKQKFKTNLEYIDIALNTEKLKSFSESLYPIIRKKILSKEMKKVVNSSVTNSKIDTNYKLGNLTLLTNVKDANDQMMFDENTGNCTEIDPKLWMDKLPRDQDKKDVIMENHAKLVLFDYDPYTKDVINKRRFLGQEIAQINKHITPDWQYLDNVGTKLPVLFQEFIDHLFDGHKESITAVYHWLYYLIKERNETYLVLNSTMGTGKGTFSDIAERLVGFSNTVRVGQGFFESRFNDELKNKRLAIFDEVAITERRNAINKYVSRDRFKLLANRVITLEGKGTKVESSVKNFFSGIINNNHDHSCQLKRLDRRFSVPNITQSKLEKRLGVKKTKELHEAINDEGFIAEVGFWLLNNGKIKNEDAFYCYKGEKFHYLVESTLSPWQKFIVDRIITNGKVMEIAYIKDDFETEVAGERFPVAKTIKGFLLEHYDRDYDAYGYVKDGMIKPTNKYAKGNIERSKEDEEWEEAEI